MSPVERVQLDLSVEAAELIWYIMEIRAGAAPDGSDRQKAARDAADTIRHAIERQAPEHYDTIRGWAYSLAVADSIVHDLLVRGTGE